MLLQACLVLGDHLRDRTHYPYMRGSHVELEDLLRVGVQVVDPGNTQRQDRTFNISLVD